MKYQHPLRGCLPFQRERGPFLQSREKGALTSEWVLLFVKALVSSQCVARGSLDILSVLSLTEIGYRTCSVCCAGQGREKKNSRTLQLDRAICPFTVQLAAAVVSITEKLTSVKYDDHNWLNKDLRVNQHLILVAKSMQISKLN